MPRTCERFAHTANIDTVKSSVESFLASEGFSQKDYKGEQVWKKGTGLATAMQYMKIEYAENEVVVYAWIQMGVGDIGGKEHELKGIVGAIPKKNLRSRVDKLGSIIKSL